MKIVAIMGKSASGKDTLMNRILRLNEGQYHQIITCTTRPPREGEIDGFDYIFMSDEEMAEAIFNGKMIECVVFNDWGYGTHYDALDEDKINIGVYNPEGVEILKDSGFDVYCIYVDCNTKERLIRSLNRETNPDINEIIRRYTTDEKDFRDVKDLANIIANTDQGHSIESLALVLNALIKDWAK